VAADYEVGEAVQGLLCRVGVDGGQRAGVAGIEGIEQRARLGSAHFAQDDPIRPPAQSRLQKVIEGDLGLEGIGLAFGTVECSASGCPSSEVSSMTTMRSWSGIALARMRKSVVFPLPVPPLISSVFPLRICSAKKVRKRSRQRAASDQVIDRVTAAGELANCERRIGPHNGRNDCRKAASVRELRVQERVVFVEPFAELIGNDFEAGAKPAGVEGNPPLRGG
jgi:hypothetical protein